MKSLLLLLIIFCLNIENAYTHNLRCENIFVISTEANVLSAIMQNSVSNLISLLRDLQTKNYQLWITVAERIIKSKQTIDPFAVVSLDTIGLIYKKGWESVSLSPLAWLELKKLIELDLKDEKEKRENRLLFTNNTERFFKISQIDYTDDLKGIRYNQGFQFTDSQGHLFFITSFQPNLNGHLELVIYDPINHSLVNIGPMPEKLSHPLFCWEKSIVLENHKKEKWLLVPASTSKFRGFLFINLLHPAEMKVIYPEFLPISVLADFANIHSFKKGDTEYVTSITDSKIYRFEPFSENPNESFSVIELGEANPSLSGHHAKIQNFLTHQLIIGSIADREGPTFEINVEHLALTPYFDYRVIDTIEVADHSYLISIKTDDDGMKTASLYENDRLIISVPESSIFLSAFTYKNEPYVIIKDSRDWNANLKVINTNLKSPPFEINITDHNVFPFHFKDKQYLLQFKDLEISIYDPISGAKVLNYPYSVKFDSANISFISRDDGMLEFTLWTQNGLVYRYALTR